MDEALDKVKDGDYLAFGSAVMEPVTFLENMHRIADRITNVKMNLSLSLGKYDIQENPAYLGKFDITSWFHMQGGRVGQKLGITSHVPGNFHSFVSRYLSEFPLNVFVAACTPMDEHGYVRMSFGVSSEMDLLDAADLVIMEVNENIPVVYGDNAVHISQIDYLYEVNRPLPILKSSPIDQVSRDIGEYIASLINDGDTIQLGIGAIPDAAAKALMNKKDLGVHTEMLTSSIADLAEAGVITGKRKTLHKGQIVGAFALGNEKLYDFLTQNPSINIMRGSYVIDPRTIAQNDNMVSVNSCVQVDLTGQICSESIGTTHYSGTGGQTDTAVGAIHSRGGRSIIAVPSTKKAGTLSTIAPVLSPGSVVTLSRNNVDFVITEHGIAKLKGRSIKERVYNLVGVAHPDFRAELLNQAKKFGYI